jgi:hypothetical protein
MDVESLYIFANMALDQWAYTIVYSLGLAPKQCEKQPLHELVMQLQKTCPLKQLRTLSDRHLEDALWLYY